jgi:hypothetical protein
VSGPADVTLSPISDTLPLVGSRTRLWAVVGLALASAACDAGEEIDVSYQRDIAPIFAAKCNVCHYPGSAIKVDLTNPFDPDEGIINRTNSWIIHGSPWPLIVDPGNVETSFLIPKVADPTLQTDINGSPMPRHIEPVTEEELAAIKQWIEEGAQNDAFFAAEVAPIFGTEVTLGRNRGKCAWCHNGDSQAPMSVLDVFDEVSGMVNARSLFGGTIVIPGDVEGSFLIEKLESESPLGEPMPLRLPRLTDDEINAVIDWVAAGAPNN